MEEIFQTDRETIKPVTDNSIETIMKYCTKLESISIIKAQRITDLSLNYISHMKFIKKVHLEDINSITTNGLLDLLEGLKDSILHLKIINCIKIEPQIISKLCEIAKRRKTNTIYLYIFNPNNYRMTYKGLPQNVIQYNKKRNYPKFL